jgi:hypothetical protein
LARKTDGPEGDIQQLARSANEWSSCLIFRLTRPLADEHDPGRRVSFAKHNTVRLCPQWTSSAGKHRSLQLGQVA